MSIPSVLKSGVVAMEIPAVCKECGNEELTWFSGVENTGGCQDGRLRLHEVRPIFYLGCECCSETLLVVHADEIVNILNARLKQLSK